MSEPPNPTASPLALVIFVAAVLAFTIGCVESPSYDDRPDDSRNVVSDSELNTFERAGFAVHLGDDPPAELAGTWSMESMVIEHDDHGYQDVEAGEMEFTFSEASDDRVEISYHYPASDYPPANVEGPISGSDGCFTAYARYDTVDDSGCEVESAELFTGCIVDDAIEDFQYGVIVQKRSGSQSECQEVMPAGDPRILAAQGPSERVE